MKFIFNKNLIFAILTICLLTTFLSPQRILANEEKKAKDIVIEGLNKSANKAGMETPEDIDLAGKIGRVINYLFGITGVIFLTVTLIGGYLWMTAGGSEEKVAKAKKLIMNGINGMIVIFLAYALVYVIMAALETARTGP